MRFVIQRVNHASVAIDGETIGSIKKGYLVLIGISQTDTEEIADKMIQKMIRLRIFSDENDKINLALNDIQGELLLISQFTLYADCKKATDLPFSKPENPIWQMLFMNISLKNHPNMFPLSKPDNSVPI